MAFLFRTPTRIAEGNRLPAVPNNRTDFDDGRGGYPLMQHINRGAGTPVAVLITGTLVVERQVPTVDEIKAATYHYLGGHDYIVSATEKALLESAGYTVLTVP